MGDSLLHRNWLRQTRLDLIRDPPGGQEEQRHQRSSMNLRIMVRPRPWARPSSALEPLHSLDLGALIDRDDAVDLTIGMQVVLAAQVLLAFALHVHGRDAEVPRLLAGRDDTRTAVFGTRDFVTGHPALVVCDALADQTGEVVEDWVAWAVFGVQALFEVFAWGAGGDCQ